MPPRDHDLLGHPLDPGFRDPCAPEPDPIEIVEITCQLKRETPRAILIFDGTRERWLPKSLAEWDQDLGVVRLPEWKAEQEGLI